MIIKNPNEDMKPIGYMYKSISHKPDWLRKQGVNDIYSVSNCISKDFTDWIKFWKHNGYWFFDSPTIIQNLAKAHNIPLKGLKLFYYLAFEEQWDTNSKQWALFDSDKSFSTNVAQPHDAVIQGYDIISFSCQTSAECSPLSCNLMAQELDVNQHCLLSSFEQAIHYLESGKFNNCEPGPYRIFQVNLIENT